MANQAASIRSLFERGVSAIVVGVAEELVAALVPANPVATTHSRNNWLATIGRPSRVEDGSRESPSHSEQDASLASLDHYNYNMGPINVENNVYYVEDLMAGSSPQAPAGWVEDTINTVVEHVDLVYRKVARVYWGAA